MKFLKKIYQKIHKRITDWWWGEELDWDYEEEERLMKELEKNKDIRK